jgi:predicted nucleotidyltransferase
MPDMTQNASVLSRIAIYQTIIEKLSNDFGSRLKTVVLFGSRARDQANENSDHDLFLVIESLPKSRLDRLREIRKVIWNTPIRINTIAKTPEEVEQNLTPLLLEIGVDGICLFGEPYFKNYRDKALKAIHQAKLKREKVDGVWCWKFDKIPLKEWEISWDGYRELS